MTVDFRPYGTLTGSSGCSDYRGKWQLTAERLTISIKTSGTAACPAALAHQHERFSAILDNIARFQIDPAGRFTLYTEDRRSLSMRRR